MANTTLSLAWKRVKAVWAARPRSMMEWYEFIRDDIVFMPYFQWIWWWTGCMSIMVDVAMPMSTEYCLMTTMCYILFTLPCLRFCSIWTKLYQQRRNAKPAEEEPEKEPEAKQKKKKAMTEEEMLEATRKRQKNRTDGRRNMPVQLGRFCRAVVLSCVHGSVVLVQGATTRLTSRSPYQMLQFRGKREKLPAEEEEGARGQARGQQGHRGQHWRRHIRATGQGREEVASGQCAGLKRQQHFGIRATPHALLKVRRARASLRALSRSLMGKSCVVSCVCVRAVASSLIIAVGWPSAA